MGRVPERRDPAITRISVDGTGRWLAAGNVQGRIVLRDLSDGSERRFRAEPGVLNDLRFSPDARWLAVASRNLALYPVASDGIPRAMREDGRNYGSAAFSEDSRTILTVTGMGSLEILDIARGSTVTRSCCSSIYGEVAFAPGGLLFASAGHRPSLWDARSGALVARLTRERDFFAAGPVVFDGARNRLLIGTQEGVIRVWDLATRRLASTSPPSPEWVDTIAVEPESGWVVYAGFRGTVRLWNPETGASRQLRNIRPSSNIVMAPGTKRFWLGTAMGAVECWDIASGVRLSSLAVLP